MTSVTATLLEADLDLALADWGVAVTYRQISPSYSPATQQASEVQSDSSLTALISGDAGQPTVGTAGQHTSNLIEFFVKQSELPEGEPKLTNRIVHGNREYEIVGFANSEDGLTYQLLCREG